MAHKKYYLNKKEILFWANKARRYLKLPKINIEIDKLKYPTPDSGFTYNSVIKVIHIQQIPSFFLLESTNPLILECKNNKEAIIFAIFHEIAHYFQDYKYNKWFYKYSLYNEYINFGGFHHEKKLERNADKIAIILFKKLYQPIDKS